MQEKGGGVDVQRIPKIHSAAAVKGRVYRERELFPTPLPALLALTSGRRRL